MAKKNEIAKVDTATIQPVEQIESLILTIRGKQVILDRDLARLYGVETGRLNEQVKRNIERFPEDFMFQLTKEEFEDWKSQFAISNGDSSRSQFATLDDEEKWKSQFAISNSIKMGASFTDSYLTTFLATGARLFRTIISHKIVSKMLFKKQKRKDCLYDYNFPNLSFYTAIWENIKQLLFE